jgi:hemolysin activation/secretion protein
MKFINQLKFFFLIFFFILFNLESAFAVDPVGKEPKVDDFNKSKQVSPPIDQPELLKKPKESEKATSDIKIKISQFNFTGNTIISNEQLKDLTSEFIGKELSYDDLKDVLRLISSFYQKKLGLWARAILPEQDINNGIIKIQIIEGRLGKVIINSDEKELNLDKEVARKYIENKISKEEILNISQIESNIRNLNAIPGIQAIASLEAGQNVGETDIIVQLQNKKNISATLQADSYGSRSSGSARGTALVNFDSLLKEGEQFTIQKVNTIGSDYNAAAASFRIGYDGTRATLRASKIRYDLGDPFSSTNPTGNSSELSASIQKPLGSIGSTNLNSNFTLSESDYENKNNTPSNTQKKITRAVAALSFNRSDDFYKGGVNYGSITATAGDLEDSSTASRTKNADGNFSKTSLSLSRLQRISDSDILQVNFSSQYAFKNLDSAEQFSLGGPYGIRAYPNSEGQGDHGMMINLELKHGFNENLEGILFYDWGRIQLNQNTYSGWNSSNTRLKNIYELQGTGIGLNWNITPSVRVNWIFAMTLGDNKGEDSAGLDNDGLTKDKRSYLSITSNF